MSAREQLIRAYAFSTLKPSSGGDFDLGARETHEPCRRKSRGKFTDPQHAKQSKQKAINTSNIIMNGLIAGKIISKAEGDKRYQAAYSRIFYSEGARNSDSAALAYYLTSVLLQDEKLKSGIFESHEAISAYARGKVAFCGQAREDVIRKLDQIIYSLDRKVLTSVGIYLRDLKSP